MHKTMASYWYGEVEPNEVNQLTGGTHSQLSACSGHVRGPRATEFRTTVSSTVEALVLSHMISLTARQALYEGRLLERPQ